jgi:hypothetical protein
MTTMLPQRQPGCQLDICQQQNTGTPLNPSVG